MIDPENDPILNASSINSEDYWFLKLNNMEQQKPEAESAEKTEGKRNRAALRYAERRGGKTYLY